MICTVIPVVVALTAPHPWIVERHPLAIPPSGLIQDVSKRVVCKAEKLTFRNIFYEQRERREAKARDKRLMNAQAKRGK